MKTYNNVYQLVINDIRQGYHITISNLSPQHISERQNDFVKGLKKKGIVKETDKTSFIFKYTYS